jgi:death-on-curing protein
VRFLSLAEVLELHRRIMQRSGGSEAVRDLPALESALAQPRMTFDGVDLYPDLPTNAAALAIPSLVITLF